jgi:hypothetical protein
MDDPFATPEESEAFLAEQANPAPQPEPIASDVSVFLDREIGKDAGAALSQTVLAMVAGAREDPQEWLRVQRVLKRHGVLRIVMGAIDIDEAPGPEPSQIDHRQTIAITTEEMAVANRAVAVLAAKSDLYQRGGLLSLVIDEADSASSITRDPGALRIVSAAPSQIRSRLSHHIRWVRRRQTQNGTVEIDAHPPDWCTRDIHERTHWRGIRRLLAVSETPIIRADGTVLQVSGYDEPSGIVMRPSCDYPDIGDPTHEDAQAAVLELLAVVCDFPFQDGTHAAAWLAGVLSPLARSAFTGPVPLTLFDANTRGSGKTLLADITSAIVTGRSMARMSQAKDEDEERKRITSIALQGDPLVLIDNVTRALGSGALDAALTSTVWAERILGRNERPQLPLRACWYATGNNVVLRGDTSRRCLHVRIESPLETPEDRRDFTHPNLIRWVTEHRGELVSHALRILRAYCIAGRPDQKLRPWGSFQEWSDLVRSALVWAGCSDPGETRIKLREAADTDASALPALLDGLAAMASTHGEPLTADTKGITSGKIARLLTANESGFDELREALSALGCKTTGRSIGNRLRSFRLRWVGSRALDAKRVKNTSYWCVIEQK